MGDLSLLVGSSSPWHHRPAIGFSHHPVLLSMCALVSSVGLLLSYSCKSSRAIKAYGTGLLSLYGETYSKNLCIFSFSVVQSMLHKQLSQEMTWIYGKTKQKKFSGQICVRNGISLLHNFPDLLLFKPLLNTVIL